MNDPAPTVNAQGSPANAAQVLRLGRIRPDAEKPIMCDAPAPKRQCEPHGDVATYRVEKVDPATGVIWRRHYRTNAAAAWAARHQMSFPPGMWDRVDLAKEHACPQP